MNLFANNPIKLVIQRGASMLESIAQTLEELMGQRGNPLNRVVTRGDLWQAGMVELRTTSGQVQAYAGVPHPTMVSTGGLDAYDAVFAPTSLTVEATPSSIVLLWDTPSTPRYAYTRVYRSDTSDFSGATILGTGAGGFYVDALGAGGVTKYYWTSHVDIDGIETGLNDAVGTPGTTGYVGNADIQDGTINGGKIVTNSITANRIFAIDFAAINANVGVLNTGQLEVQTGGFIRSANYSAGSAGWQITNTNAEFNNVTVRGILAAVTGTLGTLTMATGGYIQSSNYSVGSTGWKISETAAEFNGMSLTAATGTLGALTMAAGGYIQSSNYVSGTSGWKLLETGIEFNTGLTVDYIDVTGTKPPANATSDLFLINGNGCTINGNNVTKTGGTDNTWDSGIYSAESYTNGAAITFFAGQNNKILMVGINSDPTTNNSNSSIDYAWYVYQDGNAYIQENGVQREESPGNYIFGSYTSNTVFSIQYDGEYVRYYMDGVLKRSISAGSGIRFYVDSSFYTSGAQVNNIRFTPMSSARQSLEQGTTITSGGITFSAGGAIKGGQTDYNTGTGWFLGYSGGAYKFSIGSPATNRMTWDGSNLSVVGNIDYPYVDGSYRAFAGTVGLHTTFSTSPVKTREVLMDRSGSATFRFNLIVSGSPGTTAYAQLYKNGVAIGTTRSTTSTSYTVFNEVLSFSKGDKIQLYQWISGGSYGSYTQIFEMYCANPSSPSDQMP